MNKYKMKKETTEHMAGMVVSESESGVWGGAWYVNACNPNYERRDCLIPNLFDEKFLYRGTFGRLVWDDDAGDFVTADHGDVIIYCDPSMPTGFADASVFQFGEAGNPIHICSCSRDGEHIYDEDGEDVYCSGGLRYKVEMSYAYKQSHDHHYGLIMRPDISEVEATATDDGWAGRFNGRVTEIQRTTVKELLSLGLSLDFEALMIPAYKRIFL